MELDLSKLKFRGSDELDRLKEEARAEFDVEEVFSNMEITQKPLTFYEDRFKSEFGFSYALSETGRYFRGNDKGIIVRYAHPEDKDGVIRTCFQVLLYVPKEKE